VLLVRGVNLASLFDKRRENWTIHSKQTVDRISEQADKEIRVVLHGDLMNNNSIIPCIYDKA
jgi:hypothetical protein